MDLNRAINLSIENVKKEGITDIFERPFELDLLNDKGFVKKVDNSVLSCINSNSLSGLKIHHIDYVLLPKTSAFSFRKCALMQPLDTLKYNALVITIADIIEKARIPLAKHRVFSYRLHPSNGYLFNKKYSITTFRETASKKAKRSSVKFIISCDIANFYDHLNLHRLENILYSIGCDGNRVRLIRDLLLTWSGRDSYGLPVGSNGSRILAEASLIDIDNFLISHNIDFIRFVDDYRMFAPDAKTANYWLTLLIERLQQEGLSINTSKTKIEESRIFTKSSHFDKDNDSINSAPLSITPPEKPDVLIKMSNDRLTSVVQRSVIRAGYGGTVPTKFRELSEREVRNLSTENLEAILKSLKSTELICPEDFIKALRTCIAQKQHNLLIEFIPILEKYLQLTPYFVDILIKFSSQLSSASIQRIKDYFYAEINKSDYTPEYLMLAHIRLLGEKNYSDSNLLMQYFRNLKRNSGVYIGRVILDSLYNHLVPIIDRDKAIEVRKIFERADNWEKRAIIRIVKNVLPDDEKRPWLKNVKYIETDELFLQELLLAEGQKRKRSN